MQLTHYQNDLRNIYLLKHQMRKNRMSKSQLSKLAFLQVSQSIKLQGVYQVELKYILRLYL